MSDFWLNDQFSNDFQQDNSGDDFLNSIFDENQSSNPEQDGISPQSFMAPLRQSQQPQPAPQQQQQQPPPQQGPSQQQLDLNKQEQLYRMRQQIMQQQMLKQQQNSQNQTPQTHHLPMNMSPQMQSRSQMGTPASTGSSRIPSGQATSFASPMNQPMPHPMAQMQQQMQQQMPQVPQQAPQQVSQQIPQQVPVQQQVQQQMMNQQRSARFQGDNIQGQSAQGVARPVPGQGQGQQGLRGQPGQTAVPTQLGQPTPGQPGQSQSGNGPAQNQMAQLQIELFLVTLYDFMSRRGTPISSPPIINNKKVNLFIVYVMSQKLGGPQTLIKALQNANPNQTSPWSLMAYKLGFYGGLNDMASKARVDKELGNCYIQYLIPFEQHIATPAGQKDIQERRAYFQKQFIARIQHQRQGQGSPAAQLQSSMASQPLQQPLQPPPLQSLLQHPTPLGQMLNSPPSQVPMLHHNSPMTHSPAVQQQMNSPYQMALAVPQGMTPGMTPGMMRQSPVMAHDPSPAMQSRKVSLASNMNSPNPNSPHTQPKAAPTQLSRSSSVFHQGGNSPQIQSQSQAQTPVEDIKDRKPNIIKTYIPSRKPVETYGGIDLKAVSSVAGEIDVSKPVYLFAPELGAINIEALTMSLKNNTNVTNGEVISALNTLLVTTSDANFTFDIEACPELVDALADTGLRVLDKIVFGSEDDTQVDEDVSEISSGSKIDNIFNQYVKKDLMMDEPIQLNVDSLTGLVVEDDSDIEMDELFSPESPNDSNNSNVSSPEDEGEKIEKFDFVNYDQVLNEFRDENKYHFSKLQTKSAIDDQVLVIDQLMTITMILRNISFTGLNKFKISNNELLKDLLFKIVKYVAIYSEKFVFYRKRLCLMKDCLFLLYNIAQEMRLRSLEEAFLSFVLAASFGPDLLVLDRIPCAKIERFSYLPYGIDALTKLLVREPHNRSFMKAVLTGELQLTSLNLHLDDCDIQTTKNLICKYLNHDNITDGTLLSQSFNLFLCLIPFEKNSMELSKFAIIRTSTVTQSLFGAKLIIDLIINEEESKHKLLPINWLLDYQKQLLNLNRLSISMIPESCKNEYLGLVILKSFIMINSLLSNCVSVIQDGNLPTDKITAINELICNLNTSPDYDITFETLVSPSVDKIITNELIRQFGLLKGITDSLSRAQPGIQ